MTMHGDHPVTKAEDAAFDTTLKIVGAIALVVIAGLALWYIYS